jgi:hypothetical protein
MAMLPEYYPGLPEDPYMEYLRKLGQFQRSSSGSGQNPSFPASSYSPNALDYLDQLDQARLQQAMMPNLPKTLGSDPASMIERQFRQYQEKRQREAIPTNRSAETRGARPPANYDPLSSVQTRPRSVQPITPPSMGAPPTTGNVPMPVKTQTSAVQTTGLLDTEEPAEGGSFYDDPMRMGLLQAGLGLMSAPRYSTNPNDVTLGSALARGLGGFVQGYGGTKKRLSEAERQRIEDERDARKEEYDIMYLRALTTDAISRAQQTSATMTEKAEARRLAGQLKESQVSQILGKQSDLNQTQRVERRKQLMGMSPEMLQSEYHQFFPTAEMQETQNLREKLASYTGQPAETYAAYESKDLISAISKFEEPKKPETKPRGSQAERDEDILINATAEQANDPKVQMAFQRLFLEPSDETTQWNPQKQQTERFKTYPTIPDYYVEKFPALAQQQAQLKNQSSVVPAKPNLTEQQQRARGNVLGRI